MTYPPITENFLERLVLLLVNLECHLETLNDDDAGISAADEALFEAGDIYTAKALLARSRFNDFSKNGAKARFLWTDEKYCVLVPNVLCQVLTIVSSVYIAFKPVFDGAEELREILREWASAIEESRMKSVSGGTQTPLDHFDQRIAFELASDVVFVSAVRDDMLTGVQAMLLASPVTNKALATHLLGDPQNRPKIWAMLFYGDDAGKGLIAMAEDGVEDVPFNAALAEWFAIYLEAVAEEVEVPQTEEVAHTLAAHFSVVSNDLVAVAEFMQFIHPPMAEALSETAAAIKFRGSRFVEFFDRSSS